MIAIHGARADPNEISISSTSRVAKVRPGKLFLKLELDAGLSNEAYDQDEARISFSWSSVINITIYPPKKVIRKP